MNKSFVLRMMINAIEHHAFIPLLIILAQVQGHRVVRKAGVPVVFLGEVISDQVQTCSSCSDLWFLELWAWSHTWFLELAYLFVCVGNWGISRLCKHLSAGFFSETEIFQTLLDDHFRCQWTLHCYIIFSTPWSSFKAPTMSVTWNLTVVAFCWHVRIQMI